MNLELSKKEKKAAAASSKKAGIDFGVLPQVNLLPLEIIEKRSLKALKIRIGFAFVLLLAVIVVAYGFVQAEKSMAQSRYDRASEETIRLKAEEAQYAEVPLILGQIANAQTALRDGMYREVLWKDYLGAIAGTVPDDGIIKLLSVEAATPNVAGPAVADGLQGDGIGQLSFSVNLVEMPDTVAWINELNQIPGFADARFAVAEYRKGPDDKDPTYEFTGTVRLMEEIYSHRFEPQPEEGLE